MPGVAPMLRCVMTRMTRSMKCTQFSFGLGHGGNAEARRSTSASSVRTTGVSRRSGDQENSGGARGRALTQACWVRGEARKAKGTSCARREGTSTESSAGGRPKAGAWTEQYGQCSSTCAKAGARSEPSLPGTTHLEPWVVQTSIHDAGCTAPSAWLSDGASDASRIARAAIQVVSSRWAREARIVAHCRCRPCTGLTSERAGER